MSSTWRWFQATAIGPVAAGRRDRHDVADGVPAGRARPRAPPCRRASRRRRARAASMPSASSSRHWARAWSRVETCGKRRAVRPARRRVDRGRAGRAVAAAEQVGAQHAEPRPCRAPGPAPMSGSHQSPAASAEPVRAWTTTTCGAVRRGEAVVAVRDGQLGECRPVVELERPERRPSRAGRSPSAETGRAAGRAAAVVDVRSSGRADEARRRSGASAVAASRAWLRSAMRSSTCSRPTDSRMRSGVDAGRDLLLGLQLRVGRRRRMDDQRLRVADVRQQREDLDVVDEPAAGLDAALDAERDDAAEAALQVLHGLLVGRVRLEARVADPGHLGPRLEPLGDRQRVLAVAGDPQRQRLEALEEQERVERAERGADVAQALDAQLQDEREVAERGRVADAVVATGPGRRSPA